MRPTPTSDANELIAEYGRMIRSIAKEISQTLPPECPVSFQDLVSAGSGGLLAASRSYDGARESTFKAFARVKIRFAMVDALRAADHLKPPVRAKVRAIADTTEVLRQRLNRRPDLAEIADEMELSEAEIADLLPRENVSFEEHMELWDDSDPRLSDPATPPDELAMTEQMRQIVRKNIDRLPARYQLLIRLYYEEGLTMAQIGPQLNVHESRVSQLHTDALSRLRAAMKRTGHTPDQMLPAAA